MHTTESTLVLHGICLTVSSLTHRDNLYIGVEEENSLANFDSFFDRYNKKQITDFGFSMDAKVALDIMAAVAY
jgi:hypothetical protein